MELYCTKSRELSGTNFAEVYKKARRFYDDIRAHSKRKPYVRSPYFEKDKIFLELFWGHLFDKHTRSDRLRRLKLLPCAIELIKSSRCRPVSKDSLERPSEVLHRFAGKTSAGTIFFVQIKENRYSAKKWLISIFPVNK